MAFEQDLRAYLEARDRAAAADQPPRHIDDHDLHRHLLERLREMERAGRAAMVAALFNEWSPQLGKLARFLEMLPPQLAPVEPRAAIPFACRVLDAAIDCLEPDVSLVERLELRRLIADFSGLDAARLQQIETYAIENQLVRCESRHPARLTELGRVFLRLRGKDAVRWLMTCEVVQSTGPSDPWHAPHALLQEVMTAYGITPYFINDKGDFEYSEDTRNRLVSLGVLLVVVDRPGGVALEYRVEPSMRDVVQAVLDIGPWHTAVRALLEDERALVLPGSTANASEATVEQTKLIVHEVRNALIPVRHDIEALRAFAVEHAQHERIDTAKQGIARVLDFVEAMAQMSELITEPVARFEIGAVVDEAVGWVDASRRVVRVAPPQPVHVLAPRVRFTRAISNVVGNALQATTAGQPVRVSITHGPGVVRVVVDDGGPGIPLEHRARVFLEGVTLRPDGTGSGFGLAFARRVVEGALHGKIWCEDSDLGGARFVIEVPESSPG